MKKYGLLFALSIMSLTISGCDFTNVDNTSLGPDESHESETSQNEEEALEQAIGFMNAYNYLMSYSCEISYQPQGKITSEMEEQFRSMSIGPYFYECAKPYVHLYSAGSLNEYYDTTDLEKTIRYYMSGGEWKTAEYDLTQENNQMKYFDQQTHYVTDYERESTNYYKMTKTKLEENGFVDLSLTIETNGNEVIRILIHSIVDDVLDFDGVPVIARYELGAELSGFGSVTVTLPQING